jgi:hypothetical protein
MAEKHGTTGHLPHETMVRIIKLLTRHPKTRFKVIRAQAK